MNWLVAECVVFVMSVSSKNLKLQANLLTAIWNIFFSLFKGRAQAVVAGAGVQPWLYHVGQAGLRQVTYPLSFVSSCWTFSRNSCSTRVRRRNLRRCDWAHHTPVMYTKPSYSHLWNWLKKVANITQQVTITTAMKNSYHLFLFCKKRLLLMAIF